MGSRVTRRRTALPAVRRARLGALLVAIGLLFLQAPRLFHLLLVSHATCEHGELVEVAQAAQVTQVTRVTHAAQITQVTQAAKSAGIAAPEASSDEEAARRAQIEAGGAEDQEHDHCDALAVRHLPLAAPPLIGAPLLLELAPAAALGEGVEARPVPVLALAPKSSPPAG